MTCFVQLIKCFTDAYSSGGVQKVQKIVSAFNKEVNFFQTVFDERKEILEDMLKRCLLSENIYKDFENENITVWTWINERLADESSSVMEFTFKCTKVRQIARRLLCHMKELVRILSDGNLCLKIPEILQNDFLGYTSQKKPDLSRLDDLLPELEKLIQKGSSDFVLWSEEYISVINEICAC